MKSLSVIFILVEIVLINLLSKVIKTSNMFRSLPLSSLVFAVLKKPTQATFPPSLNKRNSRYPILLYSHTAVFFKHFLIQFVLIQYATYKEYFSEIVTQHLSCIRLKDFIFHTKDSLNIFPLSYFIVGCSCNTYWTGDYTL